MNTEPPDYKVISRRIAQACLCLSIIALISQCIIIALRYYSKSCYYSSGNFSLICDQEILNFIFGAWAILALSLANAFWKSSIKYFDKHISIMSRMNEIITSHKTPIIPAWLAVIPIYISFALFSMLALYAAKFGMP